MFYSNIHPALYFVIIPILVKCEVYQLTLRKFSAEEDKHLIVFRRKYSATDRSKRVLIVDNYLWRLFSRFVKNYVPSFSPLLICCLWTVAFLDMRFTFFSNKYINSSILLEASQVNVNWHICSISVSYTSYLCSAH